MLVGHSVPFFIWPLSSLAVEIKEDGYWGFDVIVWRKVDSVGSGEGEVSILDNDVQCVGESGG